MLHLILLLPYVFCINLSVLRYLCMCPFLYCFSFLVGYYAYAKLMFIFVIKAISVIQLSIFYSFFLLNVCNANACLTLFLLAFRLIISNFVEL